MLDKKWILTENEHHTWTWVWNIREYLLETEKAGEL